jgi:hypothetical protein
MKRSLITSILAVLILSQGCEFEMSIGVGKKDPIPESSFKSNGLNSDPATMTVDDKASTSNIFTFGNVVKFEFNNVTGLKRINDLAFPGMSMCITNTLTDSTIYFSDDLLLKIDGGTDLTPLLLDAKFKTNLPHLNNEKYNIEIKIWDKKGSGKMTFSLPFEVKASDLLSIENKDLKYSNIYFWDDTDKKVVLDNNVNARHEFILISEGLEGFDIVDGKAYPGISLFMTEKNGNEIIAEENLIGTTSENGIDPIELRDNQAPVTLSFTYGNTSNPCHLTAKIFDLKNPEKYVIIETDLVLE